MCYTRHIQKTFHFRCLMLISSSTSLTNLSSGCSGEMVSLKINGSLGYLICSIVCLFVIIIIIIMVYFSSMMHKYTHTHTERQ